MCKMNSVAKTEIKLLYGYIAYPYGPMYFSFHLCGQRARNKHVFRC
uniref:Uncharacterized protein n=1 Tax=Arundo donax TaxID=35708 RepID=A0A0A8YQH5_ARUDO